MLSSEEFPEFPEPSFEASSTFIKTNNSATKLQDLNALEPETQHESFTFAQQQQGPKSLGNVIETEGQEEGGEEIDPKNESDELGQGLWRKDSLVYHCNKCDFETFKFGSLRKHLTTDHGNFKCNICDKRFVSVHSLSFHKSKDHANMKKVPKFCELCSFSAKTVSLLILHIKEVHDELKIRKCDICDYKTQCQSKIDVHKRAVHEGKKDLKCQSCNYETAQHKSFRRHMLKYHPKQ